MSAVLFGTPPTTAVAHGPTAPKFSSPHDRESSTPASHGSTIGSFGGPGWVTVRERGSSNSGIGGHGQVIEPLSLRRGIHAHPPRPLHEQADRFHHATQRLRKLMRVALQKGVCHPRGKPPHGHFGSGEYTAIGLFMSSAFGGHDEGHHPPHFFHNPPHSPHQPPPHPPHGPPPFCPSPH